MFFINVLFFLGILFSCSIVEAVSYKYNDSNKLQQVTYDNGTVVSYEYDADGNLTKVSPTESVSDGDDTDAGTDNGGTDTGDTDNSTPETPEPAKSDSGGAFGLAFLFFTASLIALRSRFKAKLKRS